MKHTNRGAFWSFLLFAAALVLAVLGAACGSANHYREATATQDVSACLAPCAGAAAVITANVPERGAMCRCWAPNAFSYTFSYPTTAEEFSYARQRWNTGLKAAEQCRRQGFGWGPDQSGDNVVCVKPTSSEPPVSLEQLLQRVQRDSAPCNRPPPSVVDPSWTCAKKLRRA